MSSNWLSNLPDGWEVIAFKRVTELKNIRVNGNSYSDNYIGLENIESWTGRLIDYDILESPSQDEESKSGVVSSFDAGDILFGKLRPYLAKAYLAPSNGICTTELLVLRPTRILGRYLLYVILTNEFIDQVNSTTFGARMPRADWDDIGRILVPVPIVSEQQTIADYLDRETAHLDSLIAAKEHLLELLAEKRRAVITHAVTRGLNLDVSLRDSGVEWLGEIPSHWEVDIAKRHFDIDLGKMLDSNKQQNEKGELKPYLRAANVFWEGVWLDDVNQMIFTPDQLKRYRLLKGDLLVTEGGVTVGRSAIWEGELDECYYQNSLNRARPKGTVPTKYFYYWLYFLKMNGYVDIVAEKSTFGHLTNEKLAAILMTVPPMGEAIQIADSLDEELEKLAKVEKKVIEAIALLKERRISLIAAAVSGQLQIAG